MANTCSYEMKVKSKNRENIEEFYRIMNCNYYYSCMEFDCNRHMGGRVFEADYIEDIKKENNYYVAILSGTCAWSVYSCMFEGEHTYYNSFKKEYKEESRSTTASIESKRLNLDIEIFSEECGCEFMEHYIVKQGEVLVNDCVDYVVFDIEEFETKEEAEEELGVKFTDEEWNNRNCSIERGGVEWEFTI